MCHRFLWPLVGAVAGQLYCRLRLENRLVCWYPRLALWQRREVMRRVVQQAGLNQSNHGFLPTTILTPRTTSINRTTHPRLRQIHQIREGRWDAADQSVLRQ